jgi:hypothetical protein
MKNTALTSAVRTVVLATAAMESAKVGAAPVKQAQACSTCNWQYDHGTNVGASCAPNGEYWLCETDGYEYCNVTYWGCA